jgi:hypothetical protein
MISLSILMAVLLVSFFSRLERQAALMVVNCESPLVGWSEHGVFSSQAFCQTLIECTRCDVDL